MRGRFWRRHGNEVRNFRRCLLRQEALLPLWSYSVGRHQPRGSVCATPAESVGTVLSALASSRAARRIFSCGAPTALIGFPSGPTVPSSTSHSLRSGAPPPPMRGACSKAVVHENKRGPRKVSHHGGAAQPPPPPPPPLLRLSFSLNLRPSPTEKAFVLKKGGRYHAFNVRPHIAPKLPRSSTATHIFGFLPPQLLARSNDFFCQNKSTPSEKHFVAIRWCQLPTTAPIFPGYPPGVRFLPPPQPSHPSFWVGTRLYSLGRRDYRRVHRLRP